MTNSIRIARTSAMVLAVVLVAGCTPLSMADARLDTQAKTMAPLEGKALIVFVRPPSDVTAVDYQRTPLYEVKNNDANPEIIGILPAKTKVAFQTDPGNRLFMAIGETASFMTADVLPNKVYYVYVMSHVGKRRAEFTFKAVDAQEQTSKDFTKLLASSKWVEKTEATEGWAYANMVSVRSKQSDGYRLWTKKADSEKPRLLSNEGIDVRPQSSEGGASASGVIQIQPAVQTTEEKLRELKRLNDAGLISKEVYLEQQRAILSKP